MNRISKAIYQELMEAPLLVGDLPGAPVWNRGGLADAQALPALNFDQKLGHLYEEALCHLIEASESLELVARGLQVFGEEGRTLGELDFVLFDRDRRQHIHLELAVKFYLGVHADGSWRFPGPDPRDNWLRKLERMSTHQLILSGHPCARKILLERLGIQSISVEQLVFGRLFLPVEASTGVALEAMAPDAKRGQWLTVREWDRLFPDVKEVKVIPKALWPVELSDGNRDLLSPMSVSDLQEEAAARCTMFALDDRQEPLFLVPDEWEQRII